MLVTVGLTLAGVIPPDLTITLGCDVLLTAWLVKACWACRPCRGGPWASREKWPVGLSPRTHGVARWAKESEFRPRSPEGEVAYAETRTTQGTVPNPRKNRRKGVQVSSTSSDVHQRGPTRSRGGQKYPPRQATRSARPSRCVDRAADAGRIILEGTNPKSPLTTEEWMQKETARG